MIIDYFKRSPHARDPAFELQKCMGGSTPLIDDSLNLGSFKSIIYLLFQRRLHIIFLFHSHYESYLVVLHPDTRANWNEYY